MISDALLHTMESTAKDVDSNDKFSYAETFAGWVVLLVAEVRRLREDNEALCRDSAKEHRCLKSICGMLTDAGCATGEFHDLAMPVRELVAKLAESRRLLGLALVDVHRSALMREIEAFLGNPP